MKMLFKHMIISLKTQVYYLFAPLGSTFTRVHFGHNITFFLVNAVGLKYLRFDLIRLHDLYVLFMCTTNSNNSL